MKLTFKILQHTNFTSFKALLEKPRFSFLEDIRFHAFVRVQNADRDRDTIVFTIPQIKKLVAEKNHAVDSLKKNKVSCEKKIERLTQKDKELGDLRHALEVLKQELVLERESVTKHQLAIKLKDSEIQELEVAKDLAEKNNVVLSGRIPEISEKKPPRPARNRVYDDPTLQSRPAYGARCALPKP